MNRNQEKILKFDLLSSDKTGISVTRNWNVGKDRIHDLFLPHRDDHYILVMAKKGSFRFMLDFEELAVHAPFILIILPEQVHKLVEANDFEVSSIDFIPSLISLELQSLLHKNFLNNNIINAHSTLLEQVEVISSLMFNLRKNPESVYNNQSVHALLLAIISLIAGVGSPLNQNKTKETRTVIIAQQFQWLLKNNYVNWKKPSQYAIALAVSVSHLNDSVREVTGSSVSNHIQQHVILAAKRLLFFSKKNVKEISYDLGFEDPVYFNVLFKKIAGITPLQFRLKFRD